MVETKSTEEARQGDRRRISWRVLLRSMVVVVLVFAALWVFFLRHGDDVAETIDDRPAAGTPQQD
jgi:hypothetical protein